MRILWYECRKILDIRVLLGIAVFTFLFYSAFSKIRFYPNGENGKADVYLREELTERVGPELDASELGELLALEAEIDERWREQIAQVPELAERGFADYHLFKDTCRDLFTRDERTEEETAFVRRLNDLMFTRSEYYTLYYLRQSIDELKGDFGADEWVRERYYQSRGLSREEAERPRAESIERYGEEDVLITRYWERRIETEMRDWTSLLPWQAVDTVQYDLVCVLTILCGICCAALIVPVQIRERVRAVRPLVASSRKGRRVFSVQGAACLLVGALVWAVQAAVYLLMIRRRGMMRFLDCPMDNGYQTLWVDIRFGGYLAALLGLALAFTLGVCALLFLISRAIPNYVAGFAAAVLLLVPAGSCYILRTQIAFEAVSGNPPFPLHEIPDVLIPAAAAILGMALLLRRERGRDLR